MTHFVETPPHLGVPFQQGGKFPSIGGDRVLHCNALLWPLKAPNFLSPCSAAQSGHFNAIWVGFQQGGTTPSVEATTHFTRLFQQRGLPGSFKHVKLRVMKQMLVQGHTLRLLDETPKVHFKVRKMPFSTPRKKGPKSQLKCPKKSLFGELNVQNGTSWTFELTFRPVFPRVC